MRIGVLTAGGDCPGLNAAIRAVARSAMQRGDEAVGIRRGYRGLAEDDYLPLDMRAVSGILHQGGTILSTSSFEPIREGAVDKVAAAFAERELDAVVAIGGEHTMEITRQLHADRGLPLVGVPKTIDNDVGGTDFTFGFDTAVQIVTDAIDRLHTTAQSHDRVMVVEVMGRHAGWIAIYSGIAGGADLVLVPEVPFDIAEVCARIEHRHRQGANYSIVVVAEGATPKEGTLTVQSGEVDQFGHVRLGGTSNVIQDEIGRRTGFETRVTILGHVLRGGTPTAYDRVLATRFGIAAMDAVHDGAFGTMAALRGDRIERVPIGDAIRD